MRTLLLMRHAKSDWSAGVDDFERPLNARGRRAAPMMGAWLREGGCVPDCALVSTAHRARETWERLSPSFGRVVPATFRDDLYHSSAGRLLQTLQNHGAGECVLILAHNPGLQAFVAAHDPVASMPTAAIARFEADCDWRAMTPDALSFCGITTPKALG